VWDNAYLEQAKSDWEIYQVLIKKSHPACHELHYLQMTTEKPCPELAEGSVKQPFYEEEFPYQM
jgi:hypothetical protein